MNQRDLLAESEDVMKQNEAKPIRMDYPLGKNTQMAIYSLRHVCMRQTEQRTNCTFVVSGTMSATNSQ